MVTCLTPCCVHGIAMQVAIKAMKRVFLSWAECRKLREVKVGDSGPGDASFVTNHLGVGSP